MATQIIIPADLLEQWAADEARLLAEIAERQKKLDLVRQRRQAAAVLAAANSDGGHFQSASIPEMDDTGNMTGAIQIIMGRANAPLSRKDVRRQLAEMGFPANRLENYFYTAVSRLLKKNRISENPDGNLWKADDLLQ